jgi:hypothetical protein
MSRLENIFGLMHLTYNPESCLCLHDVVYSAQGRLDSRSSILFRQTQLSFASFSSVVLWLSAVLALVTAHFIPVSSSKIFSMVFCVFEKDAISRYLFAVSSGCLRIETTAEPIVARFAALKGSLPESKMAAVC